MRGPRIIPCLQNRFPAQGKGVVRHIALMHTQGEVTPVSDGKTEKRSPLSGLEKAPSRKSPVHRPAGDGDVGNALRSIYQKTVDEAVPSEMLDLLGKLG